MELILASTSPYRRQLLARLQLPFSCRSPEVAESALPGEAPESMAARLARAKARAVASRQPQALVIGSDQVASIGGRIMGKPGCHERAMAQLQASSGKEVIFHTGVALAASGGAQEWFHVEPFSVHFRDLSDKMIETYLQIETPYDCAGSFKWEGLGIALFTGLRGNDPTSLEGLPLIALIDLLQQAGLEIL